MTSLTSLTRQTANINTDYPERIVQFGAGNFLRGFADWMIEVLNEETDFASAVVVVKVTPGRRYDELDEQDGLFHVILEGVQNGQFVHEAKLITCIQRTVYPYEDYEAFRALARQPDIRFLISNTTETGIQYNAEDRREDKPPSSFPAKLTLFLYERFIAFDGAQDKGCIIIPTELIPENGPKLREIVLQYAEQWQLDADFQQWVRTANIFCNTLVDRIVTGFPKEQAQKYMQEIGYEDPMLAVGEPYHSWVIEAPAAIAQEFPVDRTSLNVQIVQDVTPYRQRKIRILNGLHTSMVFTGYLLGLRTVRECVEHEILGQFLQNEATLEIIPSMDMPEAELQDFADAVFDRFRNPSIKHHLLDIAVYSCSKINARIIPSIQGYNNQYQRLPQRLVLVFATFIRFYQGTWQGQAIPLSDDKKVIQWFREQWENCESTTDLVYNVLKNEDLWETDLTTIPGFAPLVTEYIDMIESSNFSHILQQLHE